MSDPRSTFKTRNHGRLIYFNKGFAFIGATGGTDPVGNRCRLAVGAGAGLRSRDRQVGTTLSFSCFGSSSFWYSHYLSPIIKGLFPVVLHGFELVSHVRLYFVIKKRRILY